MPAHMVYRTSLGLVEWCTYMCRGQHVNLGGGGGAPWIYDVAREHSDAVM